MGHTFALFILFIFSNIISAQVTTGTIQGKVMDENSEPISFASIVIKDTSTNYIFGTTTQENGYYIITNLSPSSTYRLEVSYLGYHTEVIENVHIKLGNTTNQNFNLKEESLQLDEVVVISINGETKRGNEALVNETQIKRTPTINRSIQDLTRNLSENNLNSFAGASNRFNNLNIDGIANNDVIGFQEPASGASGSSANGTPGSLSRSQPIGLGVIKQLSVKLAPFDVSIGNFNGANLNIVTKNGTNSFESEVYAYGNNQAFIGKYADGQEQNKSSFYDLQFGAGIGGAVVKDKLFYYVNFEQALSSIPVLNAPGSETSNIPLEDVTRVRGHLITNYNYDPGTFTNADLETSSSKLFTRLDFNISSKHKLTLRNNYVDSYADNLEWNASIFNFGNQGYRHNSTANSLALELKSNFKSNLSNNLTLGYNTVKENRDFEGRVFPHIQIASNSTNRIFAGTYREASVYKTDFSTFQLANKLTYVMPNHVFTFGGLAQIHNVDYGFLSAWNGRWEYRSVEDFLSDRPRRVRGVYNINDNDFNFVSNRPSATIEVLEAALYAQDKIRISDDFSVTLGLRLDGQYLTEDLPISQEVLDTPEFTGFDNKITRKPQLNPRLGFNYNLNENLRLSGGTGLFSGRLPYLWFAYAEYISGTEYFNIDLRPDTELTLTENLSDLTNQQPNLAEINLIDQDFTFPRDWKTNLALDVDLPYDWKLHLEGTYTEVVKGIFFQSINRQDELGQFDGADNRPYYLETGDAIKINPNFTNVFLLTNTNGGYRYNASLGLSKRFNGYSSYLGYTYGKSKDVSSTVRSSPAANYEWNQAIFGNNPGLSFSNFDLRHKIVSTHAYSFDFGNDDSLFVSFLYNGRSGSPYSFIYQGDLNRDGSSRNDLIYVPQDENEIALIDITDSSGNVAVSAAEQWQQLDNYIRDNPYLSERRGNYVERNGAKTPWNHELDAKFEFSKNLGNQKRLTISLDMLNVLNFINRDWGRLVFVPNVVNSSFSLLNFVGIENNVPQFQFNISDNETPWVVDFQNSRWRAQLGLKFSF
ncbi:TonB-dependent receptor [Flagellimonas algicola]|uniref:TonB-dependent receptor n=1 Tax=Flagellimonas algicola TaxID=2583815 RepID=A0ABY2WLW0_9FLAO|nr:TonB-dependent receptor [Allomuricauda algicola]TMU55965.1 TonB-dependent receptor [Allomuricauda algicola]